MRGFILGKMFRLLAFILVVTTLLFAVVGCGARTPDTLTVNLIFASGDLDIQVLEPGDSMTWGPSDVTPNGSVSEDQQSGGTETYTLAASHVSGNYQFGYDSHTSAPLDYTLEVIKNGVATNYTGTAAPDAGDTWVVTVPIN